MKRMIFVALLAVAGMPAQNPNPTNGKRLFEVKACYECHGWRGQGGLNGPRLAQTKLNLPAFRNILRNPPPSNMPPYREAVLTDREVADLFAYIQSFPPPQPSETIPLLKN
ncbi:MAG: cytochrome c [Acidobacteriia bacterium]|nr:cytochrome c [Terriglobia bacterium]